MITTSTLFFRSRGVRLLIAGATVIAAVCAVVPPSLTLNPVDSQTSVVLANLPALGGGVFWALLVRSPMPELEQAAPQRRLARIRTAWFLAGLAGIVIAGGIGFGVRGLDLSLLVVHARNAVLAVGIGTLCGMWLPRRASWIPLAAFAGACWLAGTRDNLGTPYQWAIPCYPATSVEAAVIALSAGLVGVLAFVMRPPLRRE